MNEETENAQMAMAQVAGINIDELKDNEKEMLAIYSQLFVTYCQKNRDYGNSFDKTMDEHGLVAANIRMADKINRFRTLANNPRYVKSESIKDTMLDLANYAAMTARYIDKTENVVFCKGV